MDKARRARAGKAAKAAAYEALGSGRVTPEQAVLAPPKPLWATCLSDMLLACPGIGPIRVREVCEGAGVWPLTPMVELTHEERNNLANQLRDLT